ncbi:hypothetical protein HYU09_03430 [Candidatus Woesearchaeota archaeon]|nr:hypothetical protein [Candidatus Woesearchaeota archaeon]
MKYDGKAFNSAVQVYKSLLGNVKSRSFLIVFNTKDKNAFLSIAPLSRALHELGNEINATGINDNSESLKALKDVWEIYKDLKEGKSRGKTTALKEFMQEVEKKIKGEFESIFKGPDYIIEAKENGFEGSFGLPFKNEWFREYKSEEMDDTCKKIWKDVYNIKDDENVSIGFVLIPKDEMLGHPLEDYLDSYSICWHMLAQCNGKATMGSYTHKKSMREKGDRISELRATLLGCELCRDIDEEIFKKYKKLSKLLNLQRIKPIDASFFVSGKGYPGKHLFGEVIGYPTKNKKTRWQSPGQMIYKLDFYPQTALEERDPLARVGFTDTIPLDIFIETCNIDWKEMRERNCKIKSVVDRCEKIRIIGEKFNGVRTNLEVGLIKKDGSRRWVKTSDTDVREKINSEYLKRTGIKAGNMANIPGGEAFTTPEYMKGTFLGDVVISLDQSYMLSGKEPLVIEAYGDSYKVISGPKEIVEKLKNKKRESWELIAAMEKNKSAPKELIDLQKSNFDRIGELGINTNPKARLCEYLIVNEKIARMIHIALGSGFEADRSTTYHTDIVIDSPRQKLDIYGIDKDGKEHWIIKKGDFVA